MNITVVSTSLMSLVAAFAVCVAAEAANEEGQSLVGDSIYEVTFRRAETNTVDLHLFLRAERGKFTAGVTAGPLGPTEVDCSGLALDGNSVTGSLKATIGFDGYYPQDGKPVVYECRLNARIVGEPAKTSRTDGMEPGRPRPGNRPEVGPAPEPTNGLGSEIKLNDRKLLGTFEGTVGVTQKLNGVVEGKLTTAPDLSGYQVMDLQMENGAGAGTLGPKSYGNRVYPKLFMKDGKFVQNLIYGWGGRVQINYFESAIAANDLRFDGKTLGGALTVRTTGGQTYLFTFDGIAVGRQIGGTFKKQVDGKEETGGSFHGGIKPVPARPLDQAVHYLELHNAVHRTWDDGGTNTLQLMVSVPCVNGKFGAGVAYAAAWNHVYHDVDASGLTLTGDKLAGELKVTMNPDPYMPPDKKAVPASYAIEAKVADGRIIRGTYTGMFKDRKVSGPVFGELLDQPPVPEPVAINFKLDDGVNNGAPWHRRTWINFVAIKGHAETGGMSNNKGGWKGTFKKADVKFDGAVFTATVDGTVDETHSALVGAYTFKLTGKVMGAELIGTCDTYRDGKLTKSGTPFMGGFGPVRTPSAPKPDAKEDAPSKDAASKSEK